MSEADGRRTSRDKRKEEMVGAAVTASALPAGASTSALQTAGNASLTSIDGKLPALTQKNAIPVALGDGPHMDAFSRLRVSNPVTLFESVQRYGDDLLKWETAVSGTGVATFSAADCGVVMSTGGTASGAYCQRMTRQHFRYQAGKSMLWFQTFNMGAHVDQVQVNIGCAITNGTASVANGILFRRSTTGLLYFVIVTDTSGSAATPENIVQSLWNIDPLDGTGPSGITLDDTATQILVIDLQFLGVGRVRCGFDIGGTIVWAHEFNHANDPAFTTVYMRTATLAAYLSVRNQAIAASSYSLLHISTAVIAEGGDEDGLRYQHTHNNGTTSIGVTTRRPVLSIRAKTTGPNSVRNTGRLQPTRVSVNASTNSCLYELVLNGTLTGASWSSVNATYSLAEKDVSATAISGGVIIGSAYASTSGGLLLGNAMQKLFSRELALVYSARGNVQDVLSIVCTSKSGTSNVLSSIDWDEAGI